MVDSDPFRFMDLVSECDLMIALKLHAGVLAMCRSVPVVSLEYQPKCRDFMESMGLEDYNLRADYATESRVLFLAHEAMERSEELAEVISVKAQHYQRLLNAFARQVKEQYYGG